MKYTTEQKKELAFLIGVTFRSNISFEEDLKELTRLAETAGLEVVGQDGQYIREITPATLLGSGKLEEIKEKIKSLNANVVIVDYELSGSQASNISEILGNREIVIARELTKIHEEFIRGKVLDVLEKQQEMRGEFVILVKGAEKKEEEKEFLNSLTLEEHYKYYSNKNLEKKEIIKKIAKDRNTNKNEIYKYFIDN